MKLEQYAASALAAYNRRHEIADDLQYNSAGFHFDRTAKRFVVTVRDMVVGEFKSITDVSDFSMMHNSRIHGA